MQQHRMIFGVIIAACMLNPIYLVNAINEASVLELYLSDEVRRIVEEQMPVYLRLGKKFNHCFRHSTQNILLLINLLALVNRVAIQSG